VEIRARGLPDERLRAAVDAAFAAVERVHALMSFHEADSDVSRLNRMAAERPVRVDAWTWTVLREAVRLSRLSRGAFDITVGGALVAQGFLPRAAGPAPDASASWRDLELWPGRRVRFRRPLRIDLGGIAKGFAVDQAVIAMREAGATAGVVNAGGDLRVFGAKAEEVRVRHPSAPQAALPLGRIRQGALATSAPYFSNRRWRGRVVSPLRNPRTGVSCTQAVSVSVRASTCMRADALTKLVLADPARALPVLTACKARAWIVTGA
jgi:thiamine biosynthesis lipoprotein